MSNTQAANTSLSSPAASSRGFQPNWFTQDIQSMMHGFGDCSRPLYESAAIIESIAHQNMSALLCQLSNIAATRNARVIGLEDILFLLRKDKMKLRRLLKYMDLRDIHASTLQQTGVEEEEHSTTVEKAQTGKKRKRICSDFLSTIDQTGELLALLEDDSIDVIKQDRLLRAEMQAQGMDTQQYAAFSEARHINFSKKYKSTRFKDWLFHGVNIDAKPNSLAMETICHLTYETIAQIVDLALIVKKDMQNTMDDPMFVNIPNVCPTYPRHPAIHEPTPGLTSPLQSPPSTPTHSSLNTSGGLGVPSLGSPQGSVVGTTNKPKSSKKKKGDQTGTDLISAMAIKPAHIREAMRRYNNQICPFSSLIKLNTGYSPRMRLLCS